MLRLMHRLMTLPVIPPPTGHFRTVGFRDFETEEHVRYRAFYPAHTEALSERRFAFWASHPRTFEGFAWFLGLPAFLLSHLKAWKIPAAKDLDLVHSARHLPLYLFSHGLGGTPEAYSAHAIEIASHGYVVCMPHHRDQSAAWMLDKYGQFQKYQRLTFAELRDPQQEYQIRRRQLEHRSFEVSCIVNDIPRNMLFARKTKLDSIGKCVVGGHSFGGATAVYAAENDDRIMAAALADVWMLPLGNGNATPNSRGVPLLDIQSKQWLDWELNFKNSSLLKPLKTIEFPGSRHGNFSDFALASSLFNRALKIIGPADPKEELAAYSREVLKFFKGENGQLPK